MKTTTIVDSELQRKLIDLRRDLHAHPELSWQEERTAQRISEYLEEIGVSNWRTCGTGVIAEIGKISGKGSRMIALRADIDALPVEEETELSFASTYPGKMHACGHDGHTAMLLGAATLLQDHKDELPTAVRLIFQPAEEKASGAQTLIKEGVLDDVGLIFGGHLDRHYATGSIIVSDGVMNASTDTFRIVITGQGGHAARPHESIDAVVVGSLMVMALQTIVSREINPAHPSVLTVGKFVAGTAANVIAGQAVLEGTIRAQEPVVRAQLKEGLERIVTSIGHLHGAAAELQFLEMTPAVINQPVPAALARKAAAAVVGGEHVRDLETANMGGEDFSYYLEKTPGCYVRFGAQVPGKEGFPAHSSKFEFDEAAIAIGAQYYFQIAIMGGKSLLAEGS